MRVELIHGRHLLCGHILANDQVRAGQKWAAADGSNRSVRIVAVAHDWVTYTWDEYGEPKYHDKSIFAFQCRYCLVLDGPEIPKEFQCL